MVFLSDPQPITVPGYKPDKPIPCKWGAMFSDVPTVRGITLETDLGFNINPEDKVLCFCNTLFFRGKQITDPSKLIEEVLNPLYFGKRYMLDALSEAGRRGEKGWFFPATIEGGLIGKFLPTDDISLVGTKVTVLEPEAMPHIEELSRT